MALPFVKLTVPAMARFCSQPVAATFPSTDNPFYYQPFYPEYEFQVLEVTGGPFVPQRSLDGVNWDPCSITPSGGGNSVASISETDEGRIFSVKGRAAFRLASNTGTDSIVITIRAA